VVHFYSGEWCNFAPALTPQSLIKNCKPRKTGTSHPTGRVSKRQWLAAALDVLTCEGVESVRVAELARTLRISKSGFYWHFRNRDQLLEEMKSYWVDEFSQQIISEVLDQDAPIQKRLLNLVSLIRTKQAGIYDLAFTSWAKRDPSVHELLDQVRDMRIEFVKRLLSSKFRPDDELEARARLFVVYFSWSEVMCKQADTGLEGEPLDKIIEIIAGP
jgi:AcrR family transcriptional regulator